MLALTVDIRIRLVQWARVTCLRPGFVASVWPMLLKGLNYNMNINSGAILAMSKIYRSLKTKFYNSKFYWTQLKRSSIEFAWWGIRSPGAAGEWKKTRKHEVSFYKTLFSQFEVTSVFDIGENVGDKTEIFLSTDCT